MSVIYKIDPRIKILVVLLFTILVFIIDKLIVTVSLVTIFFILRLAARISFRRIGFLKTFSMLAAFIIVVQILLYPGENYIIKPLFPSWFPLLGGVGSLKWEGLFAGLTICFRLAALMLLLPMLSYTTSPDKIAAALASMGFNYRIAFIITTAFNMISVFEEQGRIIMEAQKLRGMRVFESRSFFARLKAYPSLVVPLVLGAMRKAQLASVVMDSRAFGVYKTRTWLLVNRLPVNGLPVNGHEKPEMKGLDFFLIVICIIFSAAMLFFNFFPPWKF